MGIGVWLEPLTVVVLLFDGAWINRSRENSFSRWRPRWQEDQVVTGVFTENCGQSSIEEQDDATRSRSQSPSLLPAQESKWRKRELRLVSLKRQLQTPNTAVFRNRILSRLLRKFPFLVECWYWALVYWIYQLGRAFTAVTLVEGTIHVARNHALELIEIETRWAIFWELPIQHFFLVHPRLMASLNWLYSFIHIPGTIAFLVWLYYYTITSNRLGQRRGSRKLTGHADGSPSGPALYEARRRTMAVCNLLAFVVFTIWPCMPPRLLSDPSVKGPAGELARSFGFVDTVHGEKGAGSVWTQNRFCNRYAAMPSLHFGYSLLIGLTIMTIPLPPAHRRSQSLFLPFFNRSHPALAPLIKLPSCRRLACILLGFLYPFSILIAIIATANHFVLDAVAGGIVCGLGWYGNAVLLNLLPLEDYFLWCLRIHKPVQVALDLEDVKGHVDGDEVAQTVVLST